MQHSTIDQSIAAALERLAAEHQRSADHAEKSEERTFFRRWAGAFRKALYHFGQGVRCEPTPSGAQLVPSATRAIVHQVGRDGKCSCEARDRGCWHAALAVGVEVGMDDLGRLDGGDDEEPADEYEIQYEDVPYPHGIGNPDAPADGEATHAAPWRVGAYVRSLMERESAPPPAAAAARPIGARLAAARAAAYSL